MFYYTNFIAETNAWWLRRVRPIWIGATLIWAYWIFHRYYFFGKMAVKNQRAESEQQNLRRAALNKRNFGYNNYYKPTFELSRKKQILELLGDNYDQAIEFENRLINLTSFEELQERIDSENEY